jgi:uncharacterized FlaG/YvyC family protein
MVLDCNNEKSKPNSLSNDNIEQVHKDGELEAISKELEKLTESFNRILTYGIRVF